ncbi:hypothetical protein [Streptomyces melanogenes]|uniref:hypothetical protein n=1 Tax=Streptomyces melanogenes TaxID=67326 RepID=UPI00167E455A|nr:hypothetical protein [Streptomyces melanogenes]GGP72143.1 hypothetical protein GCM10010278_57750 [Streptomyces melanogenes]
MTEPTPTPLPAAEPVLPSELPQAPDAAALTAEVDKWRSMSRKNEKAFKDASRELEQFRQAAVTDQERAIETARAEARTAALSEFGSQLVTAELRAQAASAGTTLPAAEFLNLSRFLGEDGQPDGEAIAAFITTLSTSKEPEYRQNIGLGRQGTSQAGQVTRSRLSHMSRAQINEARSKGLLDAVMRGEL